MYSISQDFKRGFHFLQWGMGKIRTGLRPGRHGQPLGSTRHFVVCILDRSASICPTWEIVIHTHQFRSTPRHSTCLCDAIYRRSREETVIVGCLSAPPPAQSVGLVNWIATMRGSTVEPPPALPPRASTRQAPGLPVRNTGFTVWSNALSPSPHLAVSDTV